MKFVYLFREKFEKYPACCFICIILFLLTYNDNNMANFEFDSRVFITLKSTFILELN